MRATAKTAASTTLVLPAKSRGNKVKNTHHRLSRASSRSCPSCRRPCPPRRRHPACRHRQRRRVRRRSAAPPVRRATHRVRWRGGLSCVRHQSRGRPEACCWSGPRRCAGAPPPRCAPSRHGGWRPADGERLGLLRGGLGVRAGENGPGRSGKSCPAGQLCLAIGISGWCMPPSGHSWSGCVPALIM